MEIHKKCEFEPEEGLAAIFLEKKSISPNTPGQKESAPDRIRTCNLRLRRPLLCPLSYQGILLY
jgi:hypothetical protein